MLRFEKDSYKDPPSGNLCVSPPKIDPVLGGHTRITQPPLDRHRNRLPARTDHEETVSAFHWIQLSPARLLLVCLLISLNGREIVIFSFQMRRCMMRSTGSRHLGVHRPQRVIGGKDEQVQLEWPMG